MRASVRFAPRPLQTRLLGRLWRFVRIGHASAELEYDAVEGQTERVAIENKELREVVKQLSPEASGRDSGAPTSSADGT